jgi:hypothetical protein
MCALRFDRNVAFFGILPEVHPTCWTDVCEEAELAEGDKEQLEAAWLISRAPASARVTVRVFTVSEKEKRRRWITHTSCLNKLTADELDSWSWNSPQSMLHKVAMFAYAVCVDFKSYYHQFGLPKKWRKWHVFLHKGIKYQLRTIPTGANSSPAAAQAYSEAMARLIKQKFSKVDVDVYLDNIRILANTKEALEDALRYLFELARKLKIEVNETFEEALKMDHQRYEFLGIYFDHGTKTTSLSDKTKRKISTIEHTVIDETTTLRQIMRWTSLLMYASGVTGSNRAWVYWIFKFLRRRANEQALLDAPARVWPSIQTMWSAWARMELRGEPRRWHEQVEQKTALIYTDASQDGWGAMIFLGDGRLCIRAGRWTPKEQEQAGVTTVGTWNINVLEAMAVRKALETTAFDVGTKVKLVVDNTSVLHRLPKGFSKSFALNTVLGHIHTLLQGKVVIESIEYVESARNMADALSRLWSSEALVAGNGIKTLEIESTTASAWGGEGEAGAELSLDPS